MTFRGRYARRVAAGLALSALGDALLVWPQHFVAGMAAFAAAHVAYIAALGWARRAAALGGALYLSTACFLVLTPTPAGLRALVPPYAMLLATMAWRGVARGGAAAVGGLLFLVSDAILGYSLFSGPVPYQQVGVAPTIVLPPLRDWSVTSVVSAGAGDVDVLPGTAGHHAERAVGGAGDTAVSACQPAHITRTYMEMK